MLKDLGIGASKFGSSYVTEQNKQVRLLNLPNDSTAWPRNSTDHSGVARRARVNSRRPPAAKSLEDQK